jgi:hypothetical protein
VLLSRMGFGKDLPITMNNKMTGGFLRLSLRTFPPLLDEVKTGIVVNNTNTSLPTVTAHASKCHLIF